MTRPANNDHPIHDLLRLRWSPRAFDARPVERTKLLSLLEAARWAPSSFNEQPWALLVATKDQPAEYARLLECLIEFNRSWAAAAPVLLLAVARLTFAKNDTPNRHAFHDVGLALANLTVQATAEGLFVHQMAGILPERARDIYAIPNDWEAITGVALGYPGKTDSLPDALRQREEAPRMRKSLDSFVFGGAWNQKSPLLGS